MTEPTQPDPPADDVDVESEDGFEDKQRLLDRFRGTGVGVEDPNIAGDTEAEGTPVRAPDEAPPEGS